MKRRTFLKTLGMGASLPWFGRTAFAAADARETAPQGNASTHKILTCNVRVDVAADAKTGDGWAERKELCAAVMRAQHADLIGLQECQHVHFDYLKQSLPEFESFALCRPDANGFPLNAILFSRARYELLRSGGFWLSDKPHVEGSKAWDSREARFVNWVHLAERGSGKQLRMWNTHFDHIGQVAREKAAELIVQASAALPPTLPQLFTGDLNSHATNPAIKAIAAGGWTDTYSSVHGQAEVGFTAHAFLGAQYGEKRLNGKPGARIDWIWCRGPVKALAAEVIRDSRNGHYPSDHYFMSAVVAL
jgi:endonuclease/exonuclease/phosphatase family metal-dependent hydrolase